VLLSRSDKAWWIERQAQPVCSALSTCFGFSGANSHISNSDAYHTCYVLAGLSSAQHKWHFNTAATKEETTGILSSAYQWTSEPIIEESQIYDEEDRVGTLHPVFVIPEGSAEETRAYFASKGGF
jgi:protein farnesyltransferase subunit beta